MVDTLGGHALVQEMKRVRLRLGVSSKALASVLGVHKTAIGKWEQGLWLPKPDTQDRIRRWLTSEDVQHQLVSGKTVQERAKQETSDGFEAEALCIDIAGHLNTLVERLMPSFLNGSRERRDVFREMLATDDLTYIVTMLDALRGDEGRFQRWKTFVAHNYGRFGLRREHRGKARDRRAQR